MYNAHPNISPLHLAFCVTAITVSIKTGSYHDNTAWRHHQVRI